MDEGDSVNRWVLSGGSHVGQVSENPRKPWMDYGSTPAASTIF